MRRLLEAAQREGVRVAIVSNEIGELGIDRALLGGGAEAFIELEGGCVCCELSDDLVETLQRLYEEIGPDRIVIETSGAALPFDTTLNFWREPVSEWIGDDMAVVVVNAEQVHEGRDLEGTFEDQVHSADLLVLNKCDLVPADVLDEVERRLREIEPEAPIVRTAKGDLDPALAFPPDADAVDRSGDAPVAPPHAHEHFATEIRAVDGLDRAGIEALLDRDDLLRAKGFVVLDDAPHLVQVVGRRIEIEPTEIAPPPGGVGKLVLITRSRGVTHHHPRP